MAAVAVFSVLTGCNKQNPEENPDSKVTVFSASILNTRTNVTIDGDKGKVAWVLGDTIVVTDASKASAKYTADQSGASSTFSLAAGETAVGSGPYTASYNGATPDTVQTYSSTAVPYITMTASSDDKAFEFSVTSGLLKISLSGTGLGNIKKIMVKGDGTSLYQLDCGGTGIDVSSAKDFWIALPAGTYRKFYFTNASGLTNIQTAGSGKEVEITANHIRPLTVNSLSPEGFDCIWMGSYAASGYPVFWADRNIGAEAPEDGGYFFSWGNTVGRWKGGVKGKSDPQFSDANYNETPGSLLPKGTVIAPDSGNDAARVILGGKWRLPTKAELVGLSGHMHRDYDEDKECWAFKFSGNTLLMPLAGMVKNSTYTPGTGFYWGNESHTTNSQAIAFQIKPNEVKTYWGTRSYGFSIRPVKE